MNKIFEKANEDGSKIINYTDRIEMYDTNNKLCGILGNLDSYEDLQKKAELGEHYKHLYSEVKKQKDDVVDFIHKELDRFDCEGSMSISMRISYFKEDLLRMLGEIDNE